MSKNAMAKYSANHLVLLICFIAQFSENSPVRLITHKNLNISIDNYQEPKDEIRRQDTKIRSLSLGSQNLSCL